MVDAERIERIVLTLADRRGTLPLRELMRLKNRGIQIQDGGDLLEAVTGKVAVANLRPAGSCCRTGSGSRGGSFFISASPRWCFPVSAC